MEITRINLLGQKMPWWSLGIVFSEFRLLTVFIPRHGWTRPGGISVQAYSAYINELRHATMLEF